jgi:hypothetical protein
MTGILHIADFFQATRCFVIINGLGRFFQVDTRNAFLAWPV